MKRISCTVITKNEGDRLAATLEAARQVADEIVVVDSGSTDDTVAVAERYGARVILNDWPGFGPQKRFAEDVATHDWILNLDADEVPGYELLAEIAQWKSSPDDGIGGWRFRQVTVYPGRARPRPLADFHNYIRLYDRRRMRFSPTLTHDVVEPDGQPVGQMDGVCLHFSWRSLGHLARKLESYGSLQAKEITKPVWQLRLRRLTEYPLLFFKYWILRRHYTGGLYGLRTSHVYARHRASRIRKFLEAAKDAAR